MTEAEVGCLALTDQDLSLALTLVVHENLDEGSQNGRNPSLRLGAPRLYGFVRFRRDGSSTRFAKVCSLPKLNPQDSSASCRTSFCFSFYWNYCWSWATVGVLAYTTGNTRCFHIVPRRHELFLGCESEHT